MITRRGIANLENERLGLIMIGMTLLVIIFITLMMFDNRRDSRMEFIQAQGVSLARILSDLPLSDLVTESGTGGVLRVLKEILTTPEFAYVAVVDRSGAKLREVAKSGVIVPELRIKEEPSSWIGRRTIPGESRNKNFIEFHAPVILSGELYGHVRIAYFEPGYGIDSTYLPFVSTMALMVFLLTTLSYYLVKKEIRPIRTACTAIHDMANRNDYQPIDVTASGEIGELIGCINHYIEYTGNRVSSLEKSHFDLDASAKFLNYKRERIEMVLQSLPDPVVVLDETGIVNMANSRISNILNIQSDDLRGKRLIEYVNHPAMQGYQPRGKTLSPANKRGNNWSFVPENEKNKTYSVEAFPLFSVKDRKKTYGSLVVFHDISEEVLAKQSRAEFVAHVAHELKSPLNVLTMYSEALIGEEGKSREFQIDASNVIRDEVERLASLINNLLSLTRFEVGGMQISRQRVKLKEMVEDAFENISRNGYNKNCEFSIDLPNQVSAISADKDLMRIAINNILTNAIKYNKPGGKVSMTVTEDAQSITISIRDTGIGISEDDISHIYDKFFRSESEEVRDRPGHGLGLPLAKEIIELHNGELLVESVLGEGTEFIIVFRKDSGIIMEAV